MEEQRLIGRPRLEDPFAEARDETARDERIYQAVRVHGYSLRQVGEFLGLYYSTISVVLNRVAQAGEHQERRSAP